MGLRGKKSASSDVMRGVFHLNLAPRYPWKKAAQAAVCMGIPLWVGLLFGHLTWGMMANMGVFTALYVHNDPYKRRAVKLLTVLLGLALSFGLGTLSAGTPVVMALTLGVVSTAGYFICGAWRVPPPSGFFFVLACAVGTGLPVDPSAAPFRAGLACLGGAFAWCFAMSGWLLHPHGPETVAVATAYRDVAAFLAAIGTPRADATLHETTLALRAAEDLVGAGETRRFRPYRGADRLSLLVHKANALFLLGIELRAERSDPLPAEWPAVVRNLADAVPDPERALSLSIPQLALQTKMGKRLCRELTETVQAAAETQVQLEDDIRFSRRSIRNVLACAFNRHSLVLPAALRIGVTITLATLVAVALGNQRPYWVPLTCAAVMQGTTVITTFNRSLQRALGTSIGLFIGGIILSLEPASFVLVVAVMVLQWIVELVIVRNYGVAVIFITPLALTLAETGHPGLPVWPLIEARLFDTLLGCMMGLVGGLLLWRRSPSVRLPAVLSQAIRDEGQLLHDLLTDHRPSDEGRLRHDRHLLQTSLLNLRAVYDHAISEFPRRRTALESLWPAVVAVQRLGYSSIAAAEHAHLQPLPKDKVDQLDDAFDELAQAARTRQPVQVEWPSIPGNPVIGEELYALQDGLQMIKPLEEMR